MLLTKARDPAVVAFPLISILSLITIFTLDMLFDEGYSSINELNSSAIAK